MSQQPEALELIGLFELEADPESLYRRAAAELRRLHAAESGAKVELMRRDNLIDSLHGLCESYRTQVEGLQVEISRLQSAPVAAVPALVPLTKDQMEKGRDQIFSINNPYCPCDSKTFRKVAEWVEAHHGIGLTVGDGGANT